MLFGKAGGLSIHRAPLSRSFGPYIIHNERTTQKGKCYHYGATTKQRIPGEDNTNTYRHAAAAKIDKINVIDKMGVGRSTLIIPLSSRREEEYG